MTPDPLIPSKHRAFVRQVRKRYQAMLDGEYADRATFKAYFLWLITRKAPGIEPGAEEPGAEEKSG